MITLARAGEVLTLSDRLLWTDEYAWTPVVTAQKWGTHGALIVHVGKRKAGRPITLDGRDSRAWIERAQCDQLNAWAALPGAEFSLVVRGQARRAFLQVLQGDAVEVVAEAAAEAQLLPGDETRQGAGAEQGQHEEQALPQAQRHGKAGQGDRPGARARASP